MHYYKLLEDDSCKLRNESQPNILSTPDLYHHSLIPVKKCICWQLKFRLPFCLFLDSSWTVNGVWHCNSPLMSLALIPNCPNSSWVTLVIMRNCSFLSILKKKSVLIGEIFRPRGCKTYVSQKYIQWSSDFTTFQSCIWWNSIKYGSDQPK